MATNKLIYSASLGINNKLAPHELPYDEETGVISLEDAVDVVIDKAGKLVSRRGTKLVKSGNYHSRFVLDDGSFYIIEKRESDSALFKAVPANDGSVDLYGMISDMPKEARFDYVHIGNRIYYCSGYQNGVIENDTPSPWPIQIWTGPKSNIEMKAPPVGEHIDFLAGRALLSRGDELFYSEHGLVGLVDETKNRVRLESDIIMICAVQFGAFISDSKYVYFVSGNDPNEWKCKKVLNYPAIEWSREQGLIDPSFFGLESRDLSILFGTINGPVIGLPDGTAVNLIDRAVTMPDCGKQSGSLMVVDETTIIQSGV